MRAVPPGGAVSGVAWHECFAATAAGLLLYTRNPEDFEELRGLLEVVPVPRGRPV